MANSPSAHQPCPEQPEACCNFAPGVLLDEDTITTWQLAQELRPRRYALTDYNFDTPSTSLAVNVATTVNVGNNGRYERYDFPGEYLNKAQGDQVVKIRMEAEEVPHAVVTGSSFMAAFTPKNAIERRLCVLIALWNEFAENPEARMLRWLVDQEEARMIDVFLEGQDEAGGDVPHLLIRFDEPFEDATTQRFSLVQSLQQKDVGTRTGRRVGASGACRG
jgi:uncharacterized protein involved in type VI secretion and phage assembly